MSSTYILVTGASGYLGPHVIYQLLEKGYKVKGTARGSKVDDVKQAFASYGDKFQVIAVNDIAADDLSEHFKDVGAVIHTAAPMASALTGDDDAMLKGTIDGTMNLFRQAEKARIKRFIYTSSIAAVVNMEVQPWTNDTWNPITKEGIQDYGGSYMYGKTQAERALWDFAAENKNLDVTTFCPPFIFGPMKIVPSNPGYLSSMGHIQQFLTPEGRFPVMPGYIDVRDLARIHVQALDSPPESVVGRKRMLVASPHDFNFSKAAGWIVEAHPELKDRLIDTSKAPAFPVEHLPTDLKRVAEVTGFKEDEFISCKQTFLDTIDNLLAMERDWIGKGLKVEIAAQ